jgi:RNA polymerase sigma factor (sigma-70 family)
MQTIFDNTFPDQLKNEDNPSFEILYKCYHPSIEAHIHQNFGSKEDAEDVFQEGIMILLQKVRHENFILTSSLKTYLFAIARNLWLKRLRDNRSIPVDNFDSYLQEN